jgi:hypothetical protein
MSLMNNNRSKCGVAKEDGPTFWTRVDPHITALKFEFCGSLPENKRSITNKKYEGV